MKALFTRNPLIAFSIALPLLVVALFAAVTVVPGFFVDPPGYDFLIVDRNHDPAGQRAIELEFMVDDGQLVATLHQLEAPRSGRISRLYRFNHQTSTLSEIHPSLPENLAQLPTGSRLTFAALAPLKISTSLKAPDGYEFLGNAGSPGLMMDFFGASRSRSSVVIAIDGVKDRVRLPGSRRWYYDVQFLGWVVE